jgi:endonuclease YncB( thermonuclease family)
MPAANASSASATNATKAPARAKRVPKTITPATVAQQVRKAVTHYVMMIGIDAPEAQPIINSMTTLIKALTPARPTTSAE